MENAFYMRCTIRFLLSVLAKSAQIQEHFAKDLLAVWQWDEWRVRVRERHATAVYDIAFVRNCTDFPIYKLYFGCVCVCTTETTIVSWRRHTANRCKMLRTS